MTIPTLFALLGVASAARHLCCFLFWFDTPQRKSPSRRFW